MAISLALAIAGFILRSRFRKKLAALPQPVPKKQKRPGTWFSLLFVLGAYAFGVHLLSILFPPNASGKAEFKVDLAAPRVPSPLANLPFNLPLGLSKTISVTVEAEWWIIAVVLVAAIVIRCTVLRKSNALRNPKGIHRLLELGVESLNKYIGSSVTGLGETFGAYIFSLALLLVCSALLELFAIRAPTSDITMTLALALITFVMVNYYGVRKRGLFGRLRGIMLVPAAQVAEDAPRSVKRKANLKNIFQPTLIVFPIRVLSDLIIPLSLSCRLFGNMFGGMIIIEMLYYLLANYALGIPSAAGLFFNAFHPLLQAFIFITLSLNYIAEAADPEENE